MKQWLYVGEYKIWNFEDTILDFKILTAFDVKERTFEYLDLIEETKICNFSVSRWAYYNLIIAVFI